MLVAYLNPEHHMVSFNELKRVYAWIEMLNLVIYRILYHYGTKISTNYLGERSSFKYSCLDDSCYWTHFCRNVLIIVSIKNWYIGYTLTALKYLEYLKIIPKRVRGALETWKIYGNTAVSPQSNPSVNLADLNIDLWDKLKNVACLLAKIQYFFFF